MVLKIREKWLVVLVSGGFMLCFQGLASADQKQTDADLKAAAQFEQTYQTHQQELSQAYQQMYAHQRAGADTTADLQNIQVYRNAIKDDVLDKRANAGDLAKDGVANPYVLPADPGARRDGDWNGGRRDVDRSHDRDHDRGRHRGWDRGRGRHDRDGDHGRDGR